MRSSKIFKRGGNAAQKHSIKWEVLVNSLVVRFLMPLKHLPGRNHRFLHQQANSVAVTIPSFMILAVARCWGLSVESFTNDMVFGGC